MGLVSESPAHKYVVDQIIGPVINETIRPNEIDEPPPGGLDTRLVGRETFKSWLIFVDIIQFNLESDRKSVCGIVKQMIVFC